MLKKALAVFAVPFLLSGGFSWLPPWWSRADREEMEVRAVHTRDAIAQAEELARPVMEAQGG